MAEMVCIMAKKQLMVARCPDFVLGSSMEFLIEKVIDAVLEASGINEKVGRSEQGKRILHEAGY